MSFLETLRGRRPDHVPIWLMRQAGRYLPEYRELRSRHSFLEMVRTPELAAEATLQPIRRFGFDAAIIFSDIMTPLEALGIEIEFAPGPVIARPLRSGAEIAALEPAAAEPAPYVGEALRLVRAQLPERVALIGFCGAPLTLAAYLVQGGGSKEFEQFRRLLRSDPSAVHDLLARLTELSIVYVQMQVRGGAQAVMLFDSWAGLHDAATYAEFGVPYNSRILQAAADAGAARIVFALGASHLLAQLAQIPCEATGVDWRTSLTAAREHLPGRALQGNLDPAVLFADRATIEREAQRVLDDGSGGPHVFNLGHGIWPQTPIEAVSTLVRFVHSYRR
jgi:uroporphyrinogen decarboxylase